MVKRTVIDLSKYTFQRTDKSFCPCGEQAFLLVPSRPDREAPIFFLCAKCGRIAQAGVGEVSPPERSRSDG